MKTIFRRKDLTLLDLSPGTLFVCRPFDWAAGRPDDICEVLERSNGVIRVYNISAARSVELCVTNVATLRVTRVCPVDVENGAVVFVPV